MITPPSFFNKNKAEQIYILITFFQQLFFAQLPMRKTQFCEFTVHSKF